MSHDAADGRGSSGASCLAIDLQRRFSELIWAAPDATNEGRAEILPCQKPHFPAPVAAER
jgi:hypothetical protein